FTYNGARTLSSIAPFVIGRVGQARGLSWAFYLCAAAFLLATLTATQLPETKGKHLELFIPWARPPRPLPSRHAAASARAQSLPARREFQPSESAAWFRQALPPQ